MVFWIPAKSSTEADVHRYSKGLLLKFLQNYYENTNSFFGKIDKLNLQLYQKRIP